MSDQGINNTDPPFDPDPIVCKWCGSNEANCNELDEKALIECPLGWQGCFVSHVGEQKEACALMREAYPDWPEAKINGEAYNLREDRYRRGRYLTVEEIKVQWPPRPHWIT